jgi:peptide/nickel transport system ATP-binding protein
MTPILEINDLHVVFDTPEGILRAVDGVSLSMNPGDTLGLVGESGCGKTVTAMSILRLIPDPPGRITSGTIKFNGQDIASLPLKELRKIRGAAVGMVFQDPMTALSPLHRIGDQLVEAIRLHDQRIPKNEALALASEWLVKAGIDDPKRCLGEYPFRLSGGQQQRVMIASVLMTNPSLIIADEPTTALDATTQKQVLELMRNIKGDDTALLLITHNMGVVANTCSRIAVMYAGEIVETGNVEEVFHSPGHPYTRALLDAMPSNSRPGERLAAIPGAVPSLLSYPAGCRFHDRCQFVISECNSTHPELKKFENSKTHSTRCLVWINSTAETRLHSKSKTALSTKLPNPDYAAEPVIRSKELHKKFKTVHAVKSLNISLYPGETLGLVGESGCGKTTFARMIAGLETPTKGEIHIDGNQVYSNRSMSVKRDVQMVFQDPFSSLNPRMSVGDIITEGAVFHGIIKRSERISEAARLLNLVGMPPEATFRYPHEFSGGQRQRISIARAIALQPRVIICDEPVSALDVSVQAQVLNLLVDLQRELNLAYLFITHDISVVRHMAHRISIMYNGEIVEEGKTAEILSNPKHQYTRVLIEAEPRINF